MVDITKTTFEGAPTINAFGVGGVGTGIGDIWARWYDEGNSNITKEGTLGKYLLGALKGDLNISHDLQVKEIETGVKGKVVGVVPISEKLELTLLFMMMTQKTDERIMGSSIPKVVTYATPAVETTVKTGTTPTVEGCQLTSPTGFKVGDTIEVIQGNSDFGTEPEYVKIDTLDGDLVTFNPPISQLQEPLSTIKKVASINKKAGGHKLPKIFSLQVVDQENPTEDVDVYTFKRVQIKSVVAVKKGNGGKDEREGGFTMIVIPKKMTYIDDDGLTKSGYILYEKDTYFKQ